MTWIESHQSLQRHPKTIALARLLHISRAAAIGHLHCLWWWAMDYAPDGDLRDVADSTLADACEYRGSPALLVCSLIAARGPSGHGFVDEDRSIHDWDQYAGRLLDKRRSDAERKRKERGRPADIGADVQRMSDGRPADGARTVPDLPTKNPPTPAVAGASANGSARARGTNPRAQGTNPRAFDPPPAPTLYYRGVCPHCHMEINQRGTSGPFIGHAEDCTRTAAHAEEGGKSK